MLCGLCKGPEVGRGLVAWFLKKLKARGVECRDGVNSGEEGGR